MSIGITIMQYNRIKGEKATRTAKNTHKEHGEREEHQEESGVFVRYLIVIY
jgi:hypothetical protein